MDEMRYQVIITGQFREGARHWEAVRAFASLFSLSFEEALARFELAPCVVRSGLSREQAEKYCRVLQRQAIQCEFRAEQEWQQLGGATY